MVERGEVIALCPIFGGKSECKIFVPSQELQLQSCGEDKPFVKRVFLPLNNVQWP